MHNKRWGTNQKERSKGTTKQQGFKSMMLDILTRLSLQQNPKSGAEAKLAHPSVRAGWARSSFNRSSWSQQHQL